MKDNLVRSLNEDLTKINAELEEDYKESDEMYLNDIEKVIEYFSEALDSLRDSIEKERNDQRGQFQNELKNNEYYRNRKRIEDINEVYEFWKAQIDKKGKVI